MTSVERLQGVVVLGPLPARPMAQLEVFLLPRSPIYSLVDRFPNYRGSFFVLESSKTPRYGTHPLLDFRRSVVSLDDSCCACVEAGGSICAGLSTWTLDEGACPLVGVWACAGSLLVSGEEKAAGFSACESDVVRSSRGVELGIAGGGLDGVNEGCSDST